MFLDSMESPLSLESIHIYLDNIGTYIRSRNHEISRPCWLLVATVHGKPPNSDGHNFFARAPFWMFLDSMEIPLSLEYIHIYIDNIGTHIRFRNHENSRPFWLLVSTVNGKPPTSDGHKFFVRTPLWMFLNSMEMPLSLKSIHIYLDNIGTHIRSRNHENSRPCWLLVATVNGKPPTSDGHNFFVRTSFWMLLDSMERPLSLESIHM